MHWFWRATIGALTGALIAGLLGTFVVQGLMGVLTSLGSSAVGARVGAIALTALVFMTLPMVFYGTLGRMFPSPFVLGAETRCRKCGYILRGITEPRCPECGEKI